MKYVDKPSGCFFDRKTQDPNQEPVDVIMLTLDAGHFLEKCLYSIYREVPVRKLFVCDGGSKDSTAEILQKYPRVTLHVRNDIRTTGKALEFLISLVESKWFVMIDADIELSPGWYDDMLKNTQSYDVLESSKRIMAYHFYREDKEKMKPNSRSFDLCHMVKKSAVSDFRCDDDFMWRYTDILLRQTTEKSNYRYGKIDSSYHVHNETERQPYESDDEKSYWKVAWREPRIVITDKSKERKATEKNAKAVVKYLDPEYHLVRNDKGYDVIIRLLARSWVANNGPAWLKRHQNASSWIVALKSFFYHRIASGKS